MASKKGKKRGLIANSKRQAHAQLRGYLYQIWHSVNAWLDLADNDILYLEGAEDFDTVSGDTATAVQVKDTQRNITLRSQEVNDAINHYWELQDNPPNLQDNPPNLNVKFRFLTRSKIGVEQGNPFGKDQPGLRLWSRCSGDEAAITKISEFLQTERKISEEVDTFLKQAEPQEIYQKLIEPITWETDSKPASYVEQSISEKLVYHGDRHGISPSNAKKVVNHLLKETLTVATHKENRQLNRVRFLEIFEHNTRVSVPIQDVRAQQPVDLTAIVNHIKELISGSSDITI